MATEEKISVRNFKDGSSFWWVDYKVYHLDENNNIIFVCGGIENKKETEVIEQFIKRNKKKFVGRAKSQIDEPQKIYSTISFGKYQNKQLDEIVSINKRYSRWLYDTVSDIKIKEELKELLKIK